MHVGTIAILDVEGPSLQAAWSTAKTIAARLTFVSVSTGGIHHGLARTSTKYRALSSRLPSEDTQQLMILLL